MKKISQQTIDHILDSIDIVDLVSEYVKLEKRGKNYVGLCPFHNEKTPSFSVSPEKKLAHCFGCGGGGNIFQFLSQIEQVTYNQAIVKLGARLGLELEDNSKQENSYNLDDRVDLMYYAHTLVANYYNYILLNTKEAEPALNYLLNRGLTKDSIRHFNIGYAPNNNIAVEFFKTNKINLDTAVLAGLIGQNDNSREYYDIFKDRIMFPIKDDKNRTVAFSGRTMSNDKAVAKYYNTHETEIFEKRTVLYNFSDARQYINKEKNIVLCEGYMDVIRAHQAGVKNVVALMGTNIDNNKLQQVLDLTGRITLALDNDSAGQEATITIGNKLIKRTDNIFKLVFTDGKDIDEFVHSRQARNLDFNFEKYFKSNRQHFIDFKIDYALQITKNSIEEKIQYKNEILEDLSYISDAALKDILLSTLAEKFSIEKGILFRELAALGQKQKSSVQKNIEFVGNVENIYRNIQYDKKICKLFKYFFLDRGIFLEFYEELEEIEFENSVFTRLINNLVVYYNNYQIFQIHKFINITNDPELINLATYIDNNDFLIEEKPTLEIVRDYITFYKEKHNFNNAVDEIKNNLKKAIIGADYETQMAILKQLKNYKK